MEEICEDKYAAIKDKFQKTKRNSFNYSMREVERQTSLLNIYKDRVFIMTILCNKSENFYNMINTIFTIILVFTSTLLAVTNSYHFHDNHVNEQVKIAGIVINSVNVLLVSFNSQLKISQRSSEFKLKTQAFNKLNHELEMLLLNDVVNPTSVQNIITQYDLLAEHTDSFPAFIKKNVRNKYGEDYNMPMTVASPYHKKRSDPMYQRSKPESSLDDIESK